MTEIERFEKKFISEPNSGCWLWIASTNGAGYGQTTFRRTHKDAHRVAWLLYNGEIPAGLFVCHRCNIKTCVNPTHLYLATNSENIRDAIRDGIKVGFVKINERRRNAKFCKHGHEYTEKNTYLIKAANLVIGRICRTCAKLRARKRRQYACA